jgi:hypothetical protein
LKFVLTNITMEPIAMTQANLHKKYVEQHSKLPKYLIGRDITGLIRIKQLLFNVEPPKNDYSVDNKHIISEV